MPDNNILHTTFPLPAETYYAIPFIYNGQLLMEKPSCDERTPKYYGLFWNNSDTPL
jgi:hypothetical protein